MIGYDNIWKSKFELMRVESESESIEHWLEFLIDSVISDQW